MSSLTSNTTNSDGATTAALTLLPIDFLPTIDHVIIGRGKKYSKHSGNLRYSELVQDEMQAYADAAENKAAKSQVISRLVARVRRDGGNFVREAGATCTSAGAAAAPTTKALRRWALVDEATVRTTTAQHFRDALHSKYRSSKEMKKQKRKDRRSSVNSTDDDADAADNQNHNAAAVAAADAVAADENKSGGAVVHMAANSAKRSRCVSPEATNSSSDADADEEGLLFLPSSSKKLKTSSSSSLLFQTQLQATSAAAAAAGDCCYLPVFSSPAFLKTVNYEDVNPFEPTPLREDHQEQQQQQPAFATMKMMMMASGTHHTTTAGANSNGRNLLDAFVDTYMDQHHHHQDPASSATSARHHPVSTMPTSVSFSMEDLEPMPLAHQRFLF